MARNTDKPDDYITCQSCGALMRRAFKRVAEMSPNALEVNYLSYCGTCAPDYDWQVVQLRRVVKQFEGHVVNSWYSGEVSVTGNWYLTEEPNG